MKALSIILLVFLVPSLSKAQSKPPSELLIKKQLKGSWEWVAKSGGIRGQTTTAESTGYTLHIVIDDTHIHRYRNDSLYSSKPLKITQRKSIRGMVLPMIEGSFPIMSIRISKDSLVFSEEVYDGYSYKYRRKKEEAIKYPGFPNGIDKDYKH